MRRKDLTPCIYEDHPNCPKCGSPDTKIKVSDHTDYIHRPMQYPKCNSCGFSGMMAFESNSWSGVIVKGIFCQTWEEVNKVEETHQEETNQNQES